MKEKDLLLRAKERLGIESLNEMQRRMLDDCASYRNIMLLAPTGSGKTLAFAMPVLKAMKPASRRLQTLVIAPGRELVLQIAGVFRALATDFKTVAVYGGHSTEDERNSLADGTDILIATPGRLLDHVQRGNISLAPATILVLDEFDKTLENGFEGEMKKIMARLKNVGRTILTSATPLDEWPEYVRTEAMQRLDYTGTGRTHKPTVMTYRVDAAAADKLESLRGLLASLTTDGIIERTIVFANYRESAERIYEYLHREGIPCTLYHGALDQQQRETAIEKFNNGTSPVLVSTDLASRGLDIADVQNVIHYHQPVSAEAYTHRNGRTARGLSSEGSIYVLISPDEEQREYVEARMRHRYDPQARASIASHMATLRFGAGRKEKLSKGDIVGFLTKDAGLPAADLGHISLYDHYALVAIHTDSPRPLADMLSTRKVKGKKVRITPA